MRVPERSPADAQPDASSFREAMSRVAGAVHLITTAGAAGRAGLTATAVTTVTDTPPTLLICINGDSASGRTLVANGVFCVNTLAYCDRALADSFAGRTGLAGDARFGQGDWRTLETGAPALASSLVSFDCRMADVATIGTHRVVIGTVVALRIGAHAPALVYRERAYRAL